MEHDTCGAFDLQEALSIVEGDADLFRELAEAFIETYPAGLASIQEAVRQADSEGLRAAAHQLKGALSALAAGPARDTAAALEQMGRRAQVNDAKRLCTSIEEQLHDLDTALRARILWEGGHYRG